MLSTQPLSTASRWKTGRCGISSKKSAASPRLLAIRTIVVSKPGHPIPFPVELLLVGFGAGARDLHRKLLC
ncbi:hypothetical protein BDW68DRAFT_164728 [Aspergillus falconensis]